MNDQVQILLIEDNASDAEMTIYALKKNNLANQLLHLTDGAIALDYIFGQGEFSERPVENLPRIILLDLKMPKISGLQVLQRIRADERTRRIPVIVLTSSKEDPDIQKSYDLGANSYVVKPVEFDKFQKAISELGFYWLIANQQAS